MWYKEVDHRQRFYFRKVPTDSVVRSRLFLPRDDRVSGLLQNHRVGERIRHSDHQSRRHATRLISGLLELSVGEHWKGLCAWDWQVRFLWQYFLKPLDSFALRIVDHVQLEDPLDYTSCMNDRGQISGDIGDGGRLRHAWAFLPLMPDSVHSCRLVDGRTVGDFLASKGANLEWLPCLQVVDVIAHLIRQHKWSWLIGLERWHALSPYIEFSIRCEPLHQGPDDLEVCQITPQRMEELAYHLRSWAPCILASPNGDDERQGLLTAIQFVDSCAAGLRGYFRLDEHGNRFLYASALLVDVLRLCRHVTGSTKLESVLQSAVNIVFPSVLQSTLADLFSSRHRVLVPSIATRHRSRLFLDVALIMLQRKRLGGRRHVRFGWADSTLQLTRDWLLSAHDSILEADLVRAAEAADGLIAARFRREEWQRGGADAGSDDEIAAESQCDEYHDILLFALRRHDHIPVALGRGATKLADKVAALLHSWCFETENRQDLDDFLSSFHSFTTDMGTEMGVSSFRFHRVDIADILPDWMHKAELQADIDVDMPDQEQEPQDVGNVGRADFFLKNAVAVPGLLHIFFNLAKELASGLPDWDVFWERIKQVEKLLTDRSRREAFVYHCLRKSALAGREDEFSVGAPSLYDKRWNEVGWWRW